MSDRLDRMIRLNPDKGFSLWFIEESKEWSLCYSFPGRDLQSVRAPSTQFRWFRGSTPEEALRAAEKVMPAARREALEALGVDPNSGITARRFSELQNAFITGKPAPAEKPSPRRRNIL